MSHHVPLPFVLPSREPEYRQVPRLVVMVLSFGYSTEAVVASVPSVHGRLQPTEGEPPPVVHAADGRADGWKRGGRRHRNPSDWS
jgi:hypothetical protein